MRKKGTKKKENTLLSGSELEKLKRGRGGGSHINSGR